MLTLRTTFTIILTLVLLIILGALFYDDETEQSEQNTNNVENNTSYFALQTATKVYGEQGHLEYLLTADKVEHTAVTGISLFSKPELIIYDEAGAQNWSLNSNHAKIIEQDTLTLSEQVLLKRLQARSLLQTLNTDNAEINLNNFDIVSASKVNIIGDNFLSEGIGLTGNLKAETAELMRDARTQYLQQPNL